MEFKDLLEMGANVIQGNSDESTTNLDTSAIQDALGHLLGNSEGSGFDLGSLISGLGGSGLGDIVNSWLGNGDNSSISMDEIKNLLGSDKISSFASELGISEESASNALSDALPDMIDGSTSNEGSIIDEMLGQVGGAKGAMDMLGKIFR